MACFVQTPYIVDSKAYVGFRNVTDKDYIFKEFNPQMEPVTYGKNYWLCHITQYHIDEPLWVQLLMDNTWLMITTKPTRIAIICNSIREELIINATAIIKIKNGCVIRSKAVSILSRHNEAT
jgi:hypothetical protein